MEELSIAVREIRRCLGMRQADLARELGVKRNTVSQYESGAAPSTVVMARIYNIAPPGKWKDAIHEHLVADFKKAFPENPETAKGAIQDITNAAGIRAQFPATKSERRSEQFDRFAAVVSRIATLPSLDESVIEILQAWFLMGNSDTARAFRDAAEYLHARLGMMAPLQGDEAERATLMGQGAKTARQLAIALLRQADVAEQKANRVRPKKSAPKKA